MQTMQTVQGSEAVVRTMLGHVAAHVHAELTNPNADLVTLSRQMEQTARLAQVVLAEAKTVRLEVAA